MPDYSEIKKEIYNGLASKSFIEKIRAVKNLHKLKGDEPLQAVEQILNLDTNLGMKLTALSVIPSAVNVEYYEHISKILEQTIADIDSEIIRNSLLIIQRIPPEAVSENLKRSIFQILNDKDTDLQYQAILTLTYLRDCISREKLIEAIEPLTKHPNEILNREAEKAIQALSSSNNPL